MLESRPSGLEASPDAVPPILRTFRRKTQTPHNAVEIHKKFLQLQVKLSKNNIDGIATLFELKSLILEIMGCDDRETNEGRDRPRFTDSLEKGLPHWEGGVLPSLVLHRCCLTPCRPRQAVTPRAIVSFWGDGNLSDRIQQMITSWGDFNTALKCGFDGFF